MVDLQQVANIIRERNRTSKPLLFNKQVRGHQKQGKELEKIEGQRRVSLERQKISKKTIATSARKKRLVLSR
jgi:hypothetical protein